MKSTMRLLLTALLALACGIAWPDNPRFPEVRQRGLNEIPEMPAPGPGAARTCPANQVMHGLNGLTPICMPTSCPQGYVLTGINNNQPVCKLYTDITGTASASCPPGKVLQSFANNSGVCVDPPAGAQGPQGPQGPAGVAGGGLKYAVGTGCDQCPHGSSGNVCKFKNQNGDLLNAAAVGGSCRAGLVDANFGFWTY